jgi:hypothetical protein
MTHPRTTLLAWLFTLAACAQVYALDAVGDLALKPNDRTFDCGQPITELVAAGLVTDELHFPGGIYYHTTPIVLNQDSLALTGQGIARWRRVGAFRETAAAIFVYLGPPDKPAWKISGDGVTLLGLNIWSGFYSDPWRGVGIEWSDWGLRDIQACSFCGWDIAWRLASSNHNDNSTVTRVAFNGNRVDIRGEESQASGWDFRGVTVNGRGEVFCELLGVPADRTENSGGGNWFFSSLKLNEPRLLFRLRTSPNTCHYEIHNFKADNNAAGWRVLEMVSPGPLDFRMEGQIGEKAVMGAKPIVIPPAQRPNWTPPENYQHLDVELFGPNPKGGAVWRPTLEECRP